VPPHEYDTSEHKKDMLLHPEHVICMTELSDDLRKIIDAWDSLPKAVKAGIVAMVAAAQAN
jgi:hypothetical protein